MINLGACLVYLGCDVIELKTAASTGTFHLLIVRFSMRLNSAGNFSNPQILQKHSKNLLRLGAQALLHTCGAFYLKGSLGQFSKPVILASKLPTPGPKSLLWSVLLLGLWTVKTFLPRTSLVCVVIVANPLQQRPAGNAHKGHIYSSRLISPDTWTEAEKK